MEPYKYPEGPVISYGWGIENRIGVGILEGSEVNNSTLDNIYGVFDMMGKEIGVNDVPVVFRYEGSVQTETAQEVSEDIEKNNETEKTDKEPEETDKTAGDVRKSTPIPEFKFVFSLLSTLTAALYMNKS